MGQKAQGCCLLFIFIRLCLLFTHMDRMKQSTFHSTLARSRPDTSKYLLMLHTGEGKIDSRGQVWWMRKTLNDQHQTHNIYMQMLTISRRRPSVQTLLLISQMSRGGELVTHWRGQGIKLLKSMGEFWSQSTAKLSFSLFFHDLSSYFFYPHLSNSGNTIFRFIFFPGFWDQVPGRPCWLLIRSSDLISMWSEKTSKCRCPAPLQINGPFLSLS